ncbi:hypothetical protein JOC78_002209 [Bacillus ectoiniformans]|nr:hypothetical protein [Bacillus ectoiniformans]
MTLGFHYSGVRTIGLTASILPIANCMISDTGMNTELLAILSIHYLSLPAWIRLPSHSHLLKNPASY